MEPTAAAGVAALGIFMLIPIGLGVLFAVFWLISIIDVTKNDFTNPSNKTMWLALLLLVAPIGTILYQVIGKNQKVKPEATMKQTKDDTDGKWM